MIRVCTSRILEPASIIKSIVLNYQLLLWIENVIGFVDEHISNICKVRVKKRGSFNETV